MFGKLDTISGEKVTIKLDEQLNFDKLVKYANGKTPTVELQINDGRHISPDQRKKIFALLGDMGDYTGYDDRETEIQMKYLYYRKTGAEKFSMANCSMSQANKFLSFLLDFCFKFDIPFKTKTWDMIPTNYHLAVMCLRYRKCVICGQPHSDIDHYTPVGRGNRALVDHRKLYFECLCRTHHTERHQLGAKSFIEKYHIKPVRLNEQDLISLHIMTRKRMNEIDEGM